MKDSLGSTFNYNKSLHTSVFLSAAFQGLNVYLDVYIIMGFLGGSDGKESACNAGDPGLIPGWRRCPGEGNGYPTPVLLPGESHEQSCLVSYSP